MQEHSKSNINLSGKWILNLGKSDLQSPAPEETIFVISHIDSFFKLERTHVINGKRDLLKIEVEIEAEPTIQNHHGVELRTKMYKEKDSLIFDSIFHQGDKKATNIVRYYLLEDGQVLVAEEKFESDEHNHFNKWVFDKAE